MGCCGRSRWKCLYRWRRRQQYRGIPCRWRPPVTVASNLGGTIVSIAVDLDGNLYAVIEVDGVEFDNRVLRVPAGGAPVSIGVGLGLPVAVEADMWGNVFIGDAGNSNIVEVPWVGPQVVIPSSSGLNPGGIAVDSSDDLFVTDDNTNDVFEIPAGKSRTTLGTGFNSPSGIAVDQVGNVFVADNGNNQVVEIPAGGGGSATVGRSLNAPRGIAVNAAGAVFIADAGNKRVEEVQTRSVNFGSANVCLPGQAGIAPCNQTLTMNIWLLFGANGTPAALTLGAPNQDFTLAGTTCGTHSDLPYSCTMSVEFSPTSAGVRMGALQLTNGAGGPVILSVPLSGIGIGPQAAFNSSAQVAIPASGLNSPVAIAVDGAGDVFIVDTDNNRLVEVPAGGGAQITVDAELANPLGVAVDGAGDLFIADHGNRRVVEIPSGGGAWTTVGTGLGGPAGVAVDGAGDVFIADYPTNQVLEVPFGGGPQEIVVPSDSNVGGIQEISGPRGIALDSSGYLYVASSENSLVVRVPPGGIGSPDDGITYRNYSGFSAPYGVAVDAAGDLYIADYGSNSVVEVPPNGQQTTLGSGFSIPTGVAVDGAGNVFVADYGNGRALELPRSQAPSLSFDATDVGSNSLDSPRTVTLQNIGNGSSALNSPGVSAPVDFLLVSLSGPDPCVDYSFSLTIGQMCNVYIDFAPKSAGALSEKMTITDNSLNASAATQSITLTGTGIGSATPASMTSPAPGSTLPGGPVTFTWTPGNGATGYALWAGTTGTGSGADNLYYSGEKAPAVTSLAVGGLPTNGETIYVRLITYYGSSSSFINYTYTAATAAVLTTPVPGSTLAGPSVTFSWSPAANATGYALWAGTSGTGPGSDNLYYSGE
jgi:sugar lactone lactonase YvrE